MEHCKVIVVCGAEGRVVRKTATHPDHNQEILDFGDYLKLWAYIHTQETTWNGGIEFDTIIVCNDTISYDTWKYMHGSRTRNGKYLVFLRENNGGSFGGYNFAFRNTDYEYYLFTEDDLIIYGDNYYKTIFDTYKAHKRPVFVGLIGISPWSHVPEHCHGGVGFTSREVLTKIADKDGNLPCPKVGWDRQEAIREGEVPFTHKMVTSGFALTTIHPIEGWHPDNLVMPYYNLTH